MSSNPNLRDTRKLGLFVPGKLARSVILNVSADLLLRLSDWAARGDHDFTPVLDELLYVKIASTHQNTEFDHCFSPARWPIVYRLDPIPDGIVADAFSFPPPTAGSSGRSLRNQAFLLGVRGRCDKSHQWLSFWSDSPLRFRARSSTANVWVTIFFRSARSKCRCRARSRCPRRSGPHTCRPCASTSACRAFRTMTVLIVAVRSIPGNYKRFDGARGHSPLLLQARSVPSPTSVRTRSSKYPCRFLRPCHHRAFPSPLRPRP